MKIYFKLCPKEEMDLEDRQTQEVGCRRVLNYIYSLVIECVYVAAAWLGPLL